jgi:general secretion pathway protein D
MDGIPGLSDLPLVGKMFSHSQRQTEQTDIVLTLTPHIVRVLDLNESDLRPFKVGRETVTLIDLPVPIPPQPTEPAAPAPAPAVPPANPPPAATPGPILPPR